MQSVEVETYPLEDSINNLDYKQFAMLAAEGVSMPLYFNFF